MAALAGEARGDRREVWDSDSGVIFYMSHTHASSGTAVEIVDASNLPLDEFGRIEVNGQTTTMNMDAVAYVQGLSHNVLSTFKRSNGENRLSRLQDEGPQGMSRLFSTSASVRDYFQL